MERRKLLILGVRFLAVAGIAAASVPFICSLAPSEEAINRNLVVLDFPNLPEGQVVILNVEGIPLLILRPNEAQLESIHALDDHVWTKEYSTFRRDIGAFVYWGVSTRWGCPLHEEPPQPSHLAKWNDRAQWHGGYWDPRCEVSFDYAGRAIKEYAFTYNGFEVKSENLQPPSVFEKNGNRILVSKWIR